MTELRNWSYLNYQNFSDTFQYINLQIAGLIYCDSRFTDGTYVITTRIISASGRSVVTESGTHYWLYGSPESSWLELMTKNGLMVDHDCPLDNILVV